MVRLPKQHGAFVSEEELSYGVKILEDALKTDTLTAQTRVDFSALLVCLSASLTRLRRRGQ